MNACGVLPKNKVLSRVFVQGFVINTLEPSVNGSRGHDDGIAIDVAGSPTGRFLLHRGYFTIITVEISI